METATRSFVDVAGERLTELCAAANIGGSGGAGPASLLAGLLEPWGRAPIGARPAFSSDIGDDSFPVEFSIALDGDSPEIRVLFEARSATPSEVPGALPGRWMAGQELNRRLERAHGVRLDCLRQVEDLFLPTAPRARWALWHSIRWSAAGPPRFKVYLNPQAQGRDRAPAVIRPSAGAAGIRQRGGNAEPVRA